MAPILPPAARGEPPITPDAALWLVDAVRAARHMAAAGPARDALGFLEVSLRDAAPRLADRRIRPAADEVVTPEALERMAAWLTDNLVGDTMRRTRAIMLLRQLAREFRASLTADDGRHG